MIDDLTEQLIEDIESTPLFEPFYNDSDKCVGGVGRSGYDSYHAVIFDNSCDMGAEFDTEDDFQALDGVINSRLEANRYMEYAIKHGTDEGFVWDLPRESQCPSDD